MVNQEATVNQIKNDLKFDTFVIKKDTTTIYDLVNFIGYLNGKNPSAIVNTLHILDDSNMQLEDIVRNTLDLLNNSSDSK